MFWLFQVFAKIQMVPSDFMEWVEQGCTVRTHLPLLSTQFPSLFLSCLPSDTTDVQCITYQIYPVPSLLLATNLLGLPISTHMIAKGNPSVLAFSCSPHPKQTLLPASVAFWSASGRKQYNTILFLITEAQNGWITKHPKTVVLYAQQFMPRMFYASLVVVLILGTSLIRITQ